MAAKLCSGKNIRLVGSKQRNQEQRRRHPPPFAQSTDYILRSRDSSESDLIDFFDSSFGSSDESIDMQTVHPVSQSVSPNSSHLHGKWSVSQSLPSSHSKSGPSTSPELVTIIVSSPQVMREAYRDGYRQFEMEHLQLGGVILHSALLSGKQMLRINLLCCNLFNNEKTAKMIDVRFKVIVYYSALCFIFME